MGAWLRVQSHGIGGTGSKACALARERTLLGKELCQQFFVGGYRCDTTVVARASNQPAPSMESGFFFGFARGTFDARSAAAAHTLRAP